MCELEALSKRELISSAYHNLPTENRSIRSNHRPCTKDSLLQTAKLLYVGHANYQFV